MPQDVRGGALDETVPSPVARQRADVVTTFGVLPHQPRASPEEPMVAFAADLDRRKLNSLLVSQSPDVASSQGSFCTRLSKSCSSSLELRMNDIERFGDAAPALSVKPMVEQAAPLAEGCSVCAVIVTYHPAASLSANILRLRVQVGKVVLVDNTPGAAPSAAIEDAALRHGCAVIRNESNLGIAAALNIGVNWAISHGYAWVALFDQDSMVEGSYIEGMFSRYAATKDRERIGLLAPRYKDPETGVCARLSRLADDGAPLEIMTSGSLIPLTVFSDCGLFREDFFIDQVDHEFSFRIRNFGHTVVICPEVFLLHATGQPKRHSLLGLVSFRTTHHSAPRRYYMTRNTLFMMRQYGRRYPAWAWHAFAFLLFAMPIKILLAEEGKWAKLRNIGLGAIDALLGRLGKRVEI